MTAKPEHARLLISQSRYDLAEAELKKALGEDPQNGEAQALLAYALVRLERSREALEEVKRALASDPDRPFVHYVASLAHLDLGDSKQALARLEEACRLDPEDADYAAMRAAIHLDGKEWEPALAAAEHALSLDPENTTAVSARAQALNMLGRGGEAGLHLDEALSRDPEDADLHANMGWTRLHAGDHQAAMGFFREALRLEPNHEWARSGIVEAMKARSFLYRPFLRYFLFMARLSDKARTALWIGIIMGVSIVKRIPALIDPRLKPLTMVISCLYLLVVLTTWLAQPFFDLVLRLDRFGRLCLSEDQVKGSNVLGFLLLTALGGLISWPLGTGATGLALSIGALALCLPASGIYKAEIPKNRKILWVYTSVLAAAGLGALVPGSPGILFGVFLIGIVAYTWLAARFQ